MTNRLSVAPRVGSRLVCLFVTLLSCQLANAQAVNNLQVALDSAGPGDVILLSGTYYGEFKTKVDGEPDDPIFIIGLDPNRGATIQGIGDGHGLDILHDNYRLQNFTIRDFQKGLWVENADNGIITDVTVTDVGNEAFKFRHFSNYWLVQGCIAQRTGQAGNYGEGFYVGDASKNWKTSTKADSSGRITFLNCSTSDTTNDGFDAKEGSHHIKYINCVADFPNIQPVFGSSTGDSGFYGKGDHIQYINCTVQNLTNGGSAFKLFEKTVNGNVYGSDYELKEMNVFNHTGAAIHFHKSRVADSSALYDDYTSNAGSLWYNSSQSTIYPAASFSEMTWNGIGGDVYGSGSNPPPSANLRIQYDNHSPSRYSNRIRPNLKLYNDGNADVSLADVKVRYYFTPDGKGGSYAERYISVGESNVYGSFDGGGTGHYLELGFTSGAGVVKPNKKVTLKVTINASSGNYDQNNDYSYGSNTSYVNWNNVAVFHNGQLVWGSTP